MGVPADREVGAGPGSSRVAAFTAADLAARVDMLLSDARADGREVTLRALEELYTTGCAQVLELEAQAVRLRRRGQAVLSAAPSGRPHTDVHALAATATVIEADLGALRKQVRSIRTAVEWLREQTAPSTPG